MAKKLRGISANKIPNLNFTKMQQTIILVTQDIHKQKNASFIKKMRQTFLPSSTDLDKGNHLDGSIVAKANPNKVILNLVNELRKDPSASPHRVNLIKNLLQIKQKEYSLDLYRNMMIQSALPIYLGNISPAAMQIMARVYRLYIEKLNREHKKQLLALHSKQLRNVNTDRINLNDILDNVDLPPSKESIKVELQIVQKLLEDSAKLMETLMAKMTFPLELSELDQYTSRNKAVKQFMGEISKTNLKKKNLTIRKALAVLDVVKMIPPLHSLGVRMIDKLKGIDDKMHHPYLMEARIHMQSVKFLLTRIEYGDNEAKAGLAPTYNKAIVAYRRSLKRTSKTNATKSDAAIFAEFAGIAHYGYVHRKLMNFTSKGLQVLLKEGKEAVDAAVVLDPRYVSLQMRLMNAMDSLDMPNS